MPRKSVSGDKTLNWLTFSLFAAPLALTAAAILGLREPGLRPRRVLWASGAATVFSLGLACAAAVFLALNGPATSPVIGLHGVGFAIRIDALSAVLFALVSFVGVVVVRFSRNGVSWTYCDLNGAGSHPDLTFEINNLPVLDVSP